MSLVKYCRCDDRLIHGQVIYKWVKHLGVKKIVVVDDETTNDVIAKGLIKMAAPKNIDLSILTVSESRRYFYNNQADDNVFVLIKNLDTANRMIEEGINIKKLIVGRIPTVIGKKKISQNVYINKKEFLLIDEFIKKNINVSIQMVPDEEEVELNQNINRYKGEFI
ncbi:PTS sugar transporter subunit IIB [Clostridioides difficile]|uniref:PTS sugar transporter subunit IIB n=1 Tax=Clostridioides difficile TaxID=1496 RepID=UPI00117EABD6|nr:PTS sugar transporter subunit IIB [Clostridioides difficile]